MAEKADVWQGTLALMILKTLETLGAQHGYGIARRIEQTSGGLLEVRYGTLYPALLKLEQEGYMSQVFCDSAGGVVFPPAGRFGLADQNAGEPQRDESRVSQYREPAYFSG